MDSKTVKMWRFPTAGPFVSRMVYEGYAGDSTLTRCGSTDYIKVSWVDGVPNALYDKIQRYGVEVLPTAVQLDTPEEVLTETFGPLETPGAKKFDSDKPMMELLMDGCPDALLGVGQVLTYGFKKYGGKHGWKALPDAVDRYEAAMFRHQLAKARGEILDPESGLPHSWHIACNALFLAQLEKQDAISK